MNDVTCVCVWRKMGDRDNIDVPKAECCPWRKSFSSHVLVSGIPIIFLSPTWGDQDKSWPLTRGIYRVNGPIDSITFVPFILRLFHGILFTGSTGTNQVIENRRIYVHYDLVDCLLYWASTAARRPDVTRTAAHARTHARRFKNAENKSKQTSKLDQCSQGERPQNVLDANYGDGDYIAATLAAFFSIPPSVRRDKRTSQ